MHLASSGPTYPPSSLAADPYAKIPLSGGPGYSAEPQELPLQSSMPSVQLSMASQDHSQPPIRTQYASYVQGTSAPPQMSLSTTTGENSLGVPRYMDNGSGRPSKSPRVGAHQSVHSSSSLATDPSSSDYRYGQSYGTPSEISQQTQHAPSSYGNPATQDTGSAPPSSTAAAPPPRDYFPPSQSWTTTAGEPAAPSVSYTNGSDQHRGPYPAYSAHSHSGTHTKQEPSSQHGQPSHAGGYQSQYSWSTT